ncbi:MAG TPA: PQQ-dependent sugar dehydrogenase, partial [Rhizomicrobium sp.]|nr:PQQ-dependent sugar dehydrogenase [Rhizomicrobium sp.]
MKNSIKAALLLTLLSGAAYAQINAGTQAPEASMPFTMTQVATFNLPWRIAFLPDGRMLITEKVGPIWLVTQAGKKMPVYNAPLALYGGQGGMLGIFVSPHYATDQSVYITYGEPQKAGGSSLALAKAKLMLTDTSASLEGLQVIWHDPMGGRGGQFGAQVAFAPDGNSLFLSS